MEPQPFIPIIMEGFIYLSLIAVTIYALIYGYHWYSYGTNNRTTTIALAVFLVGAAGLVGTMFISFMSL